MEKILDIIIPVYNNNAGLLKSLMSLNISKIINQIIIIDDCSIDNCEEIINNFKQYQSIQYYKLSTNVGPGLARQHGLQFVTADYVMFLDAGDLLINSNFLETKIPMIIANNPNINLFSPSHLEEILGTFEYMTVAPNNNRMHGKIYKVSFLKEYNLQFCPNCSSMNEDIGFNILCRLICKNLENNNKSPYLLQYDQPLILWTHDKNSLTRKDNYAFFNRQNSGLGKVITYTLQRATEIGVAKELIEDSMYDFFCFMYCVHMGAEITASEFVQESFEGVLHFYQNFFREFTNKNGFNPKLFLEWYVYNIKELDRNAPYFKGIPKYNIISFLDTLEKVSQNKIDNN